MNANNPEDNLYKGTTGAARFKTRGSHVINGDTTIANGGIGGAHPYLEGVTLPSYIGATDPNNDSWVDTVLGLANLGTQTNSCITSSSTCQNLSFESQTGTFETTFSATPLNGQPLDVVVGLSSGQANSAADMSCIVRFSLENKIIGRNGSGWSWNPYISYTANTKYLFRLVVDVAANTYSIYVTPEGGSEVNIGANYAFRVPASSLAWWSIVDVENRGTVEACDFAISSSTKSATSMSDIKLNSNEMCLSSYPNPSSGQVTIKYIVDEPGKVTLSLYDMSGKQLTTLENGYKEKGMHEKRYDMIAFPNGTYYINLIHDGRSSASCKLIKQSKY
ncbi:MAG: hypothetical protein A2W92_13370 [Bacteroidetes bacterium GWA2_42_15]|nr:MAG: hypothetical protein A2W92_13370 [Bacteroidetes bacterium GWA2_42_15]